jgi:ligand-binding SRPBCC domain-containing protein
LKGPYVLWHHQHHFEVVTEGVKMTDIVTYTLPMGKVGDFFAGWFILKKIQSIFEYRQKVIDKTFG